MSQLALFGDYGTWNFGDLLIADLLARSARASGATRVRVSDATRELRASAPVDRFHWWNLADCDRAVFGGGGFFNDAGAKRVARFRRFERLVRRFERRRIPYAIIGTGVGPMETPEGAGCLRRICSGTGLICVRDPESREILADCGVDAGRVAVTGDWAAGLKPADLPPTAVRSADQLLSPDDGRPWIALHLVPFAKSAERAARILELVHECLGRDHEARVCWIFENRDRRLPTVVRASRGYPRDFRAIPRQPYWVTAALLRRMSLILTSQLHVAIVGWALGVPVCGFSSHQKTRRFFAQVGRSPFQVDHQEDLRPIEEWLRAWARSPSQLRDCGEARQRVLLGASGNHDALRSLLNDSLEGGEAH
jgi:polysaccharide pyruvyl transferase WcaK-like protein